jgi:uncharacterized phage-like protein YoqJ
VRGEILMIKVSFSGHRPNNKNMGGYDWYSDKNKKIRMRLFSEIANIMNSTEDSEFHFISGGALGVDQFAFDVVNEIKYNTLKLNNVKIINEIAVPFKDQPNAWFKQEDKNRYNKQLEQADIVTYVDTVDGYIKTATPQGKYNPYKLQLRNEYMVDNVDIIIAVWDGSKGGTCNCVNYAKKWDKKLIIINPNEI